MEINVLLIVGVALLLGILFARMTDRISTPHVVGFIILGVLLGESGINLISNEWVEGFNLLIELALGFIGFGMGEHLHRSQLLKYGKSITAIAILEVLGTYFLVFGGVYFVSQSLPLALILGSLATATAPAATVDVLRQYRSKGSLTTTLLAVIGVDDALSILAFSVSAPLAISFLSGGGGLTFSSLSGAGIEIAGSILLGVLIAFPADYFLDRMEDREEMLLFMIACVFFISGISLYFHLSVILANIVFGTVTINLRHKHKEYISGTIDRVSPILYILFFVIIGARLNLRFLLGIGMLGLLFILFRTLGKAGGSYLGAYISGADKKVRNYLGISMLSLAGVPVGLALEIAPKLHAIGSGGIVVEKLVVNTIIGTALIFQVAAPLLTKYAIFKTKEAGSQKGTFFG